METFQTPDQEELKNLSAIVESYFGEVAKVIVGQKSAAQRILIALIQQGHVLLEGLPGLAKTKLIKSVAEICDLTFSRVQFTPDMLPADIIGTQIYDPKQTAFRVHKGPIFANIVLADEINRAPPKVQSALLEAMQERQVTIGQETFKLPDPFLVLATQNPVEQEGTYNLPEAQLDRFLFKVQMTYPSRDEEVKVLELLYVKDSSLKRVIAREQLEVFKRQVQNVFVSEKLRKYIVDLVYATRELSKVGLVDISKYVEIGASPRASISLELAARAWAVMQGRGYVSPQDVKDIGIDVLRHRITLSIEAQADGVTSDQCIQRIFNKIAVP